MGFGDLKSDAGVKNLNNYLADKSYIEGFQPSQADTTVFEALSSAPAASFNHALRWFNQINSYGNEKSSFPGEKKAMDTCGPDSVATAAATKGAEDDDFDLFGSDEEEDEEAERIKAERLAIYQEKKTKKPALIAKSNIILDVKPWDDETDMAEMERCVRTIEADGLLWGVSKLVPLAYGIKKLVVSVVVEDDKVGTDFLEEEITKFENLVQSVDIAAFNKI